MDSFRVIRINNLYDIWMRTFYKQAQHRPLIVQKARVKYGFRGIIPQDAWGGITTRRLIYPAHLQNDVIIDIVDLARCSDTDNVKAHLILNRYGKISAVRGFVYRRILLSGRSISLTVWRGRLWKLKN